MRAAVWLPRFQERHPRLPNHRRRRNLQLGDGLIQWIAVDAAVVRSRHDDGDRVIARVKEHMPRVGDGRTIGNMDGVKRAHCGTFIGTMLTGLGGWFLIFGDEA